jgi:predicted amidophosphoribosyltransferase
VLRYDVSRCVGCWEFVSPQMRSSSDSTTSWPCLCQACAQEIWSLRLTRIPEFESRTPVQALYSYDKLIRRLIWRAKIKDDHRALDALVSFGLHPIALYEAKRADLIIPAPSSLWGRMRGRLDIAAHFAEALGNQTKTQVLPCPWHLHWRIKKNAQRSASERRLKKPLSIRSISEKIALSAWCKSMGQTASGARHILVVDDVVTTGTTLTQVGRCLKKSGTHQKFYLTVHYLALAQSGN